MSASKNLEEEPFGMKEASIAPRKLETVQKFVSNGWMAVTSANVIQRVTTDFDTTINARTVRRSDQHFPLKMFLRCATKELFCKLAQIVSSNLTRSKWDMSESYRKYMNPVSFLDMIHFYGIVMGLENMWSRTTRNKRSNFSKLTETNKIMGYNRFNAILTALVPSNEEFEEIGQLLRVALQSILNNPCQVAADEAVIEYQPSATTKQGFEFQRHDPIPVVYIPRKPHPNGLMIFKLVTKMKNTGLPFMLDFEPHLNLSGEMTGARAVRRFIDHWSYTTKPHITVDAGIGSIDLLEYCTDRQILITMGFNPQHSREVWDMLRPNIAGNSWTAVMNQKGYMASLRIFTSEPSEKEQICKYHHLMTNAFYLPCLDCSLVMDQSTIRYSRDDLHSKTVKELKVILVENGLKKTGNKADLISKIVFTCNKPPRGVEMLLRQLKVSRFMSVAPHHQYYKKNFNAVDLIDRRFYQQHYPYALNNWRTKMILSVMTDVVASSYAAISEHRFWEFVLFRGVLSECLQVAQEGVFSENNTIVPE